MTLNPSKWVDEHGDFLYQFAVSRLRDTEAAEEVVQETFVAALRHQDQYAERGAERAWLLGILRRKIVDLIRQRNRHQTVETTEGDWTTTLFDRLGHWKNDPRLSQLRPERSLERAEFWGMLRQCLENLPFRQADAFVLREMEDKTTEEICKDLEVTSSNLWVLLYRARLGLAQCLKSRGEVEEGMSP